MTRDEAKQILEIGQNDSDDEDDELNPHEIMERFDILIEKNQISNGGSFYLQSKIYWAK